MIINSSVSTSIFANLQIINEIQLNWVDGYRVNSNGSAVEQSDYSYCVVANDDIFNYTSQNSLLLTDDHERIADASYSQLLRFFPNSTSPFGTPAPMLSGVSSKAIIVNSNGASVSSYAVLQVPTSISRNIKAYKVKL